MSDFGILRGTTATGVDMNGRKKKGTRKAKNPRDINDIARVLAEEKDAIEPENENEIKALAYIDGMSDDDFMSMFPDENEDDGIEETKWIFDVGAAFLRRAVTGRRKKRKKSEVEECCNNEEFEELELEQKVLPCWEGYVQVGMKKGKNGKMVPNCVPMEEKSLTQWFKEQWVDISRPKKDGGYEECGRADAGSGKYPKCVPKSRAAQMSAEDIASAVRRKRRAESTETRMDKKPINVSTDKKNDEFGEINEKSAIPTNPELYSRVKAEAKRKFDVYPSAYANAWLVREYKKRGGGYRSGKSDDGDYETAMCDLTEMQLSDFFDWIDEKGGKQRLRDPKGGLTAAGRAHFKRTEGANLKPGVKGAADTPEKMRRKGSFLTRFFTNPSGPMKDDNGKPTRLALSAAAWGEPVPQDASDAAKLAAKGRRMLERYENSKKKD